MPPPFFGTIFQHFDGVPGINNFVQTEDYTKIEYDSGYECFHFSFSGLSPYACDTRSDNLLALYILSFGLTRVGANGMRLGYEIENPVSRQICFPFWIDMIPVDPRPYSRAHDAKYSNAPLLGFTVNQKIPFS